MNTRRFIPIALLALVGLTACQAAATVAPATPAASTATAPSAPAAATPAAATAQGGTLTVWLMKGSLPDNLVAQLNSEFQSTHPGWTVNYQVQNWDGIVAKLTTALASNNPPDIVEMGNTQAAAFEQAGALMDLTSQRQALGGGTSSDGTSADELWLGSLNDSSMWDGKLYAMPFYAGDRVVIYRKDLFAAAGIDPKTLTSKDKLLAAAKTLQAKNASVKDFSGLYTAGQNWYELAQFIWDEGGQIAVNNNGTWQAQLESAASMKGIQDYVDYFKAASTGPADNDEMNPPQYDIFHQGRIGMMIGNLWEVGSAIGTDGKLKADQVGVFAIPGHVDGTTVPVFLGGSDLGIAANSKNQQAALDWLKLENSEKYQQLSAQAGNIPALKSVAAAIGPDNPNLQVGAAEAAAGSRFTPNDPRWASVEANNPIKAMMTQILTGKASIADAAKAADQQIDQIMNTPL